MPAPTIKNKRKKLKMLLKDKSCINCGNRLRKEDLEIIGVGGFCAYREKRPKSGVCLKHAPWKPSGQF